MTPIGDVIYIYIIYKVHIYIYKVYTMCYYTVVNHYKQLMKSKAYSEGIFDKPSKHQLATGLLPWGGTQKL